MVTQAIAAEARQGSQDYWRLLSESDDSAVLGGFEPGDPWGSGVGFDTTIFYQGTRSAISRVGFNVAFGGAPAVFFDFTEALAFRVYTYWDPPPGLWRGDLALTMRDTDFNLINTWKVIGAMDNSLPQTPNFNAWAATGEDEFVVTPDLGGGSFKWSEVFAITFNVSATAGGPGFSGNVRLDQMEMNYSRRLGPGVNATGLEKRTYFLPVTHGDFEVPTAPDWPWLTGVQTFTDPYEGVRSWAMTAGETLAGDFFGSPAPPPVDISEFTFLSIFARSVAGTDNLTLRLIDFAGGEIADVVMTRAAGVPWVTNTWQEYQVQVDAIIEDNGAFDLSGVQVFVFDSSNAVAWDADALILGLDRRGGGFGRAVSIGR